MKHVRPEWEGLWLIKDVMWTLFVVDLAAHEGLALNDQSYTAFLGSHGITFIICGSHAIVSTTSSMTIVN